MSESRLALLKNWLFRTHRVRLGVFVYGALLIRLALLQRIPAVLTMDSWDYLGAADAIYYRLDFNANWLRDVRLPVYPAAMALAHPFTNMQSDRIVVMQIVMGMIAVVLGIGIGRVLHSKLTAEAMAVFLGYNPVYILAEHTIMTETLFLLSILAFTTIALICLRGRVSRVYGVMLGLLTTTCLLIRANVIVFCIVLIGGIIVYQIKAPRQGIRSDRSARRLIMFISVVAVTTLISLSPWLWRNYARYNNISIVNFNARNILVYMAMHEPLDYTLPLITTVNDTLPIKEVDYGWLGALNHQHPAVEAERIASEIIKEQIINNPVKYLREVAQAFAGFGGFYATIGDERASVLYWFTFNLDDLKHLHTSNTPPWSTTWAEVNHSDFVYVPHLANTSLTRLLDNSGVVYLRFIRPILYTLFWLLWLTYLFRNRKSILNLMDLQSFCVGLLGLAYASTVILHAVALTDNDRYAAPFDWLLVVVLCLMISQTVMRRSRMRQALGAK